jgi:exosortase/archaeosortase family protein
MENQLTIMAFRKKIIPKRKKEENIFEKIKSYVQAQEEKIVADKKKQFVFFLLGFLLFYLVISALVLIVPSELYKTAVGKSVETILNAGGVRTTSLGLVNCSESNWLGMEVDGNCYSFDAAGKTILISWLCTGVLEIMVLISAILSSFGTNWNKKFAGVVVAIIAGIVFNLLRIVITIGIILTQNLQTVELAHDLLFRAALFIYIVAIYVLWFNWAVKE